MAYDTFELTGTYNTWDGLPEADRPVYIIPSVPVVIDAEGNKILTGRVKVTLDGTGSFAVDLPDPNDATLNPTGFGYTVSVRLSKTSPAAVSFSVPEGTVTLDMADVTPVDPSTFEPTATYVSQAALDALTATVATKETPAGAQAKADTAEADAIAAAAVDATTKVRTPRIHHLDSYNRFFGGGKWITGQATAATTTTASVSAGVSVIPVASAIGLLAGVQLLVAEGTAEQKIYTVVSVAGSDVTISGTTAYAISNGATITPLWTNSSHLTAAGYRAFAYFIANAQTNEGAYVITGTTPKVTYLGNSWISQGGSVYGDELDDRIGGATAVNAGVAGNTSAQMLARFDADVPADSDYVVFNEPAVNDDTNYVAPSTQSTQFQQLVAKILAIGAVPVYTGHVPLADLTTYSASRAARVTVLLGSDGAVGAGGTPDIGSAYTPEADSTGLGTGALLKVTTGVADTAVGARAGAALTTGQGNTFLGRESGTAATSASFNVGVGHNSLRALTSGAGNTGNGQASLSAVTTGSEMVGMGQNAGLLATTGQGNVFAGKDAGYNVNGDVTKATTTASYQAIVGYRAGADAVASYASAFGGFAQGRGRGSTALGAKTSALAAGSAAIGCDNTDTGASTSVVNEIALGTALHTTKVAGYLQIDRGQTTVGAAGGGSALPATPTKYLSVKDSAGTEYVFPVYAKA